MFTGASQLEGRTQLCRAPNTHLICHMQYVQITFTYHTPFKQTYAPQGCCWLPSLKLLFFFLAYLFIYLFFCSQHTRDSQQKK